MKIYRPITIAVGVLFVVLGGIARLADPSEVMDDHTRKLVQGSIGAPITGQDFTLTVTRVKLVRTVLKNDTDELKDALTTDGVFVAVEFDVAGRRLPKTVGRLNLVTNGGSTYEALGSPSTESVATPEPGFTKSEVALFEANPEDLAGLTLRVTPSQTISYYTVNYAVDLGIPSDQIAGDLLAKASKDREYVVPDSELRVTP